MISCLVGDEWNSTGNQGDKILCLGEELWGEDKQVEVRFLKSRSHVNIVHIDLLYNFVYLILHSVAMIITRMDTRISFGSVASLT